MGDHSGNPWDLQQRFQDKPHVALPEAKAIQGIKNELYIDKASLKLVPQGAGKFGLRFSFYALASECVIAVHQGCLEMVTGLPANDPNYSPANPLRINFVPLKNSKFDELQPVAARFSPDSTRSQPYPESLVELDISFYLGEGHDYTKAQGGFYPLMI